MKSNSAKKNELAAATGEVPAEPLLGPHQRALAKAPEKPLLEIKQGCHYCSDNGWTAWGLCPECGGTGGY